MPTHMTNPDHGSCPVPSNVDIQRSERLEIPTPTPLECSRHLLTAPSGRSIGLATVFVSACTLVLAASQPAGAEGAAAARLAAGSHDSPVTVMALMAGPDTAKPTGDEGNRDAALPPGVVLRVNGKDIPRTRFIDELDEALGESYRETFIIHVLIEDKARSLGVEASSSETEARVQDNVDQVLRERFSGAQKMMEDALKERGMTLEGWKKRLRVDSRYDVLLDKLLTKERKLSDEDLKRAFEERYGVDGVQFKIRHILKNVPVATSQDYTLQQYEQEKSKIEDEARARAEEALKKIQGGASFETVMSEYSDDPRKISGGVMAAWKGRFGPELDEAASKLAKNGMSGVIKSTDGYRIVQCTEITNNEEVHAQHILIASGSKGKGRTDEEAKKKADEVLAQVKAGGDFGQIARDNSDDPGSAARGGDLGFFGRRAMVKPFEDAVFAMDAGQVSEVVKTNFGYHIIKLIEKRTAEDRTLRQILIGTQFVVVKDRKLRPTLEGKARTELETLLKNINKPGGSFVEAAKVGSDDISTKTDGGLLKNYRQGLYGPDFDKAVNSMKAGDPPRIVKDAAGNLHLVDVEEVVKTDFNKVKDDLASQEMKKAPTPQEKSEYVSNLRAAATVVF